MQNKRIKHLIPQPSSTSPSLTPARQPPEDVSTPTPSGAHDLSKYFKPAPLSTPLLPLINSTEGTAARVRVVIESADQDDVWSTVGVSENIIEASWLALLDSVEYKLYKDEGELGNGMEIANA